GFTHHINPWGDIEPCPIVQFTRESILRGQRPEVGGQRSEVGGQRSEVGGQKSDARSLREKFVESELLRDFRTLAQETTRRCSVLERPDLLKELVERAGARDSTVRGTALNELERMHPRPSQYNPDHEIPEKSWLYRIAKRFWFNDFGAYRGKNHSRTSAPALLQVKS